MNLRDYVYRKSLALGESLMPEQVAEIMLKAARSGKYKGQLENYLTRKNMLIDVYTSCGFELEESEAGYYI